jgi:hypothetical protein
MRQVTFPDRFVSRDEPRQFARPARWLFDSGHQSWHEGLCLESVSGENAGRGATIESNSRVSR